MAGKILLFAIVFFGFSVRVLPQNINNVGIGTATPDPSAVLDLTANDKGFLVPRLPDTTSIAAPIPMGLYFIIHTKMPYIVRIGAGWLNLCNVNIPVGLPALQARRGLPESPA